MFTKFRYFLSLVRLDEKLNQILTINCNLKPAKHNIKVRCSQDETRQKQAV